MVKVKSTYHTLEQTQDKNINLKIFNKQIHFRNAYHLISLGNDILTGSLFIFGSIALFTQIPTIMGQLGYLFGSFFLFMRPIINIRHNVFIFNRENKEADKFADDNIEDFPENNVEDLMTDENQMFQSIGEIEEDTVQFERLQEDQVDENSQKASPEQGMESEEGGEEDAYQYE